jgi:nitroreductase
MRSRRSVRSYREGEIPEQSLLKLIEAARWAPSAANSQPWSFILVREPETIAALGALADQVLYNTHIRQSTAIIVICADPRPNRYYQMDCAFAAQNILLEAHSLGIGACFIGAFDETAIKELLDVPQQLRLTGLITLGWPDEEPAPPPRLGLDEILRLESYTGKRPPSAWRRATNAGMFSLAKRLTRRKRRASRGHENDASAGDPETGESK